MRVTDRPRVSVLVPTIRGWPDVRLPVEATRAQVAGVGGEIVVVDGSGRPAPGPEVVGPDVRWISRPGESVFQMRTAGYAACRGDIVAVTEDHCEPAGDFVERILAAHAGQPDAIAVGGSVVNGTTDHLVDWATFIVTQGPFIPPILNGPTDRLLGAAISYKRAALERRPDHGALGAIDLFDAAEMRRPGDVLVNDDSIRVHHFQSMGVGGTAAAQFHNGRTIAGFRRRAMARGDWVRVVGFPLLPLYRTARSVRIAWGKQLPRSVVLVTIPIMAFLHYCQAAGELVGYVAGPGTSPQRLR
jgi:Glycosyl transferase family 2